MDPRGDLFLCLRVTVPSYRPHGGESCSVPVPGTPTEPHLTLGSSVEPILPQL